MVCFKRLNFAAFLVFRQDSTVHTHEVLVMCTIGSCPRSQESGQIYYLSQVGKCMSALNSANKADCIFHLTHSNLSSNTTPTIIYSSHYPRFLY